MKKQGKLAYKIEQVDRALVLLIKGLPDDGYPDKEVFLSMWKTIRAKLSKMANSCKYN